MTNQLYFYLSFFFSLQVPFDYTFASFWNQIIDVDILSDEVMMPIFSMPLKLGIFRKNCWNKNEDFLNFERFSWCIPGGTCNCNRGRLTITLLPFCTFFWMHGIFYFNFFTWTQKYQWKFLWWLRRIYERCLQSDVFGKAKVRHLGLNMQRKVRSHSFWSRGCRDLWKFP